MPRLYPLSLATPFLAYFFAFDFSLLQRLPEFFFLEVFFLLDDFFELAFFLDADFLLVVFLFVFLLVFFEDLLDDFVVLLFDFFVLAFLAFFFIASRVVAVYWVVFGVDIAVLAEWIRQDLLRWYPDW